MVFNKDEKNYLLTLKISNTQMLILYNLIKFTSIILLPVIIITIAINYNGNLYYLLTLVLSAMLSILSLKFYPVLKKYYLIIPALLNLTIGLIAIWKLITQTNRDVLFSNVSLKVLFTIFLYLVGNVIVSVAVSIFYIKRVPLLIQ